MNDPEGYWVVKYWLKSSHRLILWKGQALNENAAKLFSRMSLLEEGYEPYSFTFVSAFRKE